jgi:divinyl chlorophyllide a 8-vinyl-reductase
MERESKRVLVAGSTGYMGRPVVHELVERGHAATALARERAGIGGAWNPDETKNRLAGAEVRFGDLADPQFVGDAMTAARPQVVVSCLASRTGVGADAWAVDYGLNRGLLGAAVEHGVEQFILLSAICVQKPHLEFQRAKLAFESELRSAPLTHSIVRPTAFFKSLAGQIARVRDGKPYLMLGDGRLTACKPISERDLARFMADCIDDPERHDAILPVGGPGPAITPRDQAELLFSMLEREPRYRRLPVWIFRSIVGALGLAGRISSSAAAKAELARIGLYYATESMLVWDEAAGRYDAAQTPSFGSDTLEAFFRDAVARADPAAELGDHSVFS